jgi:hypothetical protein
MSDLDRIQAISRGLRGFIQQLAEIGVVEPSKDVERLVRIVQALEVLSIHPTPNEAAFVKRRATQLAEEYEALMPEIERDLKTRLTSLIGGGHDTD